MNEKEDGVPEHETHTQRQLVDRHDRTHAPHQPPLLGGLSLSSKIFLAGSLEQLPPPLLEDLFEEQHRALQKFRAVVIRRLRLLAVVIVLGLLAVVILGLQQLVLLLPRLAVVLLLLLPRPFFREGMTDRGALARKNALGSTRIQLSSIYKKRLMVCGNLKGGGIVNRAVIQSL